MGLIGFVLVYGLFVVLPFKLAATWLGADRTEWLPCFAAAMIAGLLGGGVSGLTEGGLTMALYSNVQGLLSLATAALISGLVNRFVLGTTFVRGVLITVIGAIAIPAALAGGILLVTSARSS